MLFLSRFFSLPSRWTLLWSLPSSSSWLTVKNTNFVKSKKEICFSLQLGRIMLVLVFTHVKCIRGVECYVLIWFIMCVWRSKWRKFREVPGLSCVFGMQYLVCCSGMRRISSCVQKFSTVHAAEENNTR